MGKFICMLLPRDTLRQLQETEEEEENNNRKVRKGSLPLPLATTTYREVGHFGGARDQEQSSGRAFLRDGCASEHNTLQSSGPPARARWMANGKVENFSPRVSPVPRVRLTISGSLRRQNAPAKTQYTFAGDGTVWHGRHKRPLGRLARL